jgi:hypothetical protein
MRRGAAMRSQETLRDCSGRAASCGPGFTGARTAWATAVSSGERSWCRQSHEGSGQCPHGSYLAKHGRGFGVAGKGGVDARAAFEVLTGSLFDGKVHKTYGGKIVESRYSPPGMTTPLAVKDLRLVLAEAEHMAVPMPAASLVHDRLVATVARGWAELDWSALGLLAASDAGLPSATGKTSGQ